LKREGEKAGLKDRKVGKGTCYRETVLVVLNAINKEFGYRATVFSVVNLCRNKDTNYS
jgi:hypothetical protein